MCISIGIGIWIVLNCMGNDVTCVVSGYEEEECGFWSNYYLMLLFKGIMKIFSIYFNTFVSWVRDKL